MIPSYFKNEISTILEQMVPYDSNGLMLRTVFTLYIHTSVCMHFHFKYVYIYIYIYISFGVRQTAGINICAKIPTSWPA